MEKENGIPPYTQVHLTAMKLRGLAYLLELAREPQSTKENMAEVRWGISLILEDFATELNAAAFEFENIMEPPSQWKAKKRAI